jgi:hypothetical protein
MTMIDAKPSRSRNVIELADFRRKAGARPMHARLCRHCGAPLGEGEREEECSSAGFGQMPPSIKQPRRMRAE